MTPPQIRYTPENYDDDGKKTAFKAVSVLYLLSKMVIFHLHLGILEGNQFHVNQISTENTCNLDQQTQLFEESFKNNMFLWFRHQPQGNQSRLQVDHCRVGFTSFTCFTHNSQVSCLNYLLQGNKNTTNRITTSLVDNPFVFFTNSQHLPLPLRSNQGHLYGCKAKVGPWISTAFGQSHGQLRMCSRGFGDHRGTWRFLVLERWWAAFWCGRKLMVWYDSGGARGFSKILDNLAESRFLV